jgi:class 3 adenylate cyclase/TolB-like protein
MNAKSKLPEFKRRIAAILHADVHEFSRLMMSAEERTVRQLQHYLAIIVGLVENRWGRVVSATGDVLLAEFQSAVEAVHCATEIQHELQQRNLDLPRFRRMEFRIAVNTGEILADGSAIYGDGINIAARIQKFALPGGICVSGRVYEIVKGKLKAEFTFLGRQPLKNFIDPVEVYRITLPHETGAVHAWSDSGAQFSGFLTIAVLPLDNLTGEGSLGSFVDILHEEVSIGLSRFKSVSVIARESSYLFKGNSRLLQLSSHDLGIRYIVAGNIRRQKGTFVLSLRLINAKDGKTIWGERFTQNNDILHNNFDDLVKTIVSKIIIITEQVEQKLAYSMETSSTNSFHLVLKGRQLSREYTAESNNTARQMFLAALEQDPNYAIAYAELSRTYNFDWRYSWSESPEESLETALSLAQQAVRVDETNAQTLAELGFVYLFMREHENAIAQYSRALELNPNDTNVMADMADALAYAGRGEESISLLQASLKLNPFDPDWRLWSLGDAYYLVRDYEGVIQILKSMRDPSESHRLLAASYAQLGNIKEARNQAQQVLKRQPDFSADKWAAIQPEVNPEESDHYLEGLKKAGL